MERSLHAVIVKNQPKVATITSDASRTWACGTVCGQEWFQLSWDGKLEHSHISIEELTPIVNAVELWGKKWQGKLLLVQSDNTATVAMVNIRTSHDTEAMHLIRCIIFILAKFQLKLSAVHIPGKENKLADALSNNNLSFFALYSQSQNTIRRRFQQH